MARFTTGQRQFLWGGAAFWLWLLAAGTIGCGDGARDEPADTAAAADVTPTDAAATADGMEPDSAQPDGGQTDGTGAPADAAAADGDTSPADGSDGDDSKTCIGGPELCGCTGDADCAKQDDGDLCNGTLYCDLTGAKGECKPNFKSAVQCPATGDPCTVNTCAPATGQCQLLPLTSTAAKPVYCQDGNPCTANDTCNAGKCSPGQAICKCLGDGDCPDDGNLCNGSFYCDKDSFPFVCQINPATVVTCPTGLDTACEKHVCEPKTGQCGVQLAADGSPCDDEQPCSANDFCVSGQCKAGPNICPCTSNADCAAHEDGDFCNGTLYCDLSAAVPGCKVNPATVVSCSAGDDTACHSSQCDPKDGKCKVVNAAATTSCDDANLCTKGDHCLQGSCVGAANVCKCTEDKECVGYEDGNLCNGTLYCDKAKQPFVCEVNPATVVKCSDGNDTECSKSQCNPAKGKCEMVALPNGATCDADDFACTKGDACQAGLCLPGANQCKCETGPDCNQHEDGNVCNGKLYCDKTKQPFVCQVNPATLVVCPSVDDTECLENQCQPASGKCLFTPVHQGEACAGDGDVCTAGDACFLGKCEIGPATCQCNLDSDCANFDDGNLCNGLMYCDKTKAPFLCKPNPATVVSCDKSKDSACILNLCQPKTGQCQVTTLKDGSACEDGSPCSIGDACVAGQCSGTNVCACQNDEDCSAFDDGNLCNGGLYCDTQALPHVCKPDNQPVTCPAASAACQKSECVAKTGLCVGAADLAQDGSPCDDGDACTAATLCQNGSCGGGKAKDCNDNNPCSIDSCVAGGCVHLASPGTACDDGNACTSGDKCGASSVCQGVPISCDDGSPCTDDSCDGKIGCQFKPNLALCSDADPCTANDTCSGGQCAGSAKTCNDGNPCTADQCNPKTGQCVFAPNSASCDDGNLCTSKDICQDGSCQGAPVICPGSCGGVCDPLKGCQGAAVTCDDSNSCTQDVCVKGVGCAGLPLNGDPCGGAKSSACTAGLCSNCQAVSAFVSVPGMDVSLAGLADGGKGEVFAVGSASKAGGLRDGLFVRVQGGKVLQSPVILGSAGDDGLAGLLATGPSEWLAVGWTQISGASPSQEAWLVGLDAAGTVQYKSTHGTGKDDGFLGIVAMPGLPLAFGYQDDKGWVAEVKPGGGLGQDAKQTVAAQQLRWTAGHTPDPLGKVVYFAGRLVAANGTVRVAVAAVDPATLTTKWLKVVGQGGEQALGLVSSADGKGQVAVAGFQGAGAATAAWLAVLDGAGTLLHQSTETDAGPRAYLALLAGLQGDLVAVGGAEELGVNPGELPAYAWFSRWDGSGKQHLMGRALMAGKAQMFSAAMPFGGGYLLTGNVTGLGPQRQGWLVQVDANGLIPCGL